MDNNFDLRYDLINNCEIVNKHEIGKYSVNYNGEHSYSLITGDGFRTIDFKFEMRKAEGTLHWDYGAASMREYYENEEMSKRVCDHLFLIIGENEIDLFEDKFPVELKISNSRVCYDPTDPRDLEFDLDIQMFENSTDYIKRLSFRVSGSEDTYTFSYFGDLYDKEKGKQKKNGLF